MLRKAGVPTFSISVFSKKILHWTNVCLSEHAIAHPCRHTTRKAFQALQGLCNIYTILSLECCSCARMRFHCANSLVVLRIRTVPHLGRNTVHNCHTSGGHGQIGYIFLLLHDMYSRLNWSIAHPPPYSKITNLCKSYADFDMTASDSV